MLNRTICAAKFSQDFQILFGRLTINLLGNLTDYRPMV